MAFLSRKSTENKLPDVLPEHIGFIMEVPLCGRLLPLI